MEEDPTPFPDILFNSTGVETEKHLTTVTAVKEEEKDDVLSKQHNFEKASLGVYIYQ